MDYVSPGDAFSSSLEQSLLLRHQQARQAQQDALEQQRQARITRNEEAERQQAKDALAEKRTEADLKAKETRRNDVAKTLDGMLPDDIASPDLVNDAQAVGLGHKLHPDTGAVTNALSVPASLAANGDSGAPQGPMPLPVPQAALPMRIIGTPQQREKQDLQRKISESRDQLAAAEPGSPEERSAIMDYEMATGKQVPARHAAGADQMVGSFRQDPVSGKIQRSTKSIDGRTGWQDWAGDVPKDAHWMTERPAPVAKDNSIQLENQRIAAHKTATAALDKAGVPYEGKLSEIAAAQAALDERSVTGDAEVAPLMLKALVAGTGSGFRMTKSEIDQVQNARTKLQSMSASLRKWNTDPKEALFFDDAQRKEFTHLLSTVRTITERHLDPINRARNDIDTAATPRDIQKRVTALHEERSKGMKDAEPAGPATPPKRIRYDINGTVIE